MPRLKVLPHPALCPEGREFDARPGVSIVDELLAHGIDIEHACEKSCACTTCHVLVREGLDSLDEAEEKEEDMLDLAFGLTHTSRLGCQIIITPQLDGLVVSLPSATRNMLLEGA